MVRNNVTAYYEIVNVFKRSFNGASFNAKYLCKVIVS